MKYRKLANGDYSFGRGQQDFISDTLAVSQATKTRLLLLYGEWWEDKDKGLPLFDRILGQPGTPDHQQAVDLLVQGVIADTQGVINIKDFKGVYDQRTYSLSCTVETQYGDAAVEVSF